MAFLQIGTFLEYFDVMLYVHMSVLLNNLFFPKTDPTAAYFFSALAFCSTYVLRPFGALLFGYIGDKYGRQPTVYITMMLTGFSCLVIMYLPTHAEIGIAASIIVTLCRMLQGLSSLGEVVAARIYAVETLKPPTSYVVAEFLSDLSSVGSFAALAVASSMLFTSGNNWRSVFGIALMVAFFGAIARTKLRETPEFIDMNHLYKQALENGDKKEAARVKKLIKKDDTEKVHEGYKTAVMYLLTQLKWPAVFYFVYMYSGNLLQDVYKYTPEQVIHQNLIVSLIQLGIGFCFTFSYIL
jgi:MFS family permease